MLTITPTAQTVLEKRYFRDGETTWGQLTTRVATCFGKDDGEIDSFKSLMDEGDFLPNSPALMNAGTELTAYSACYVLPVEDNIDSIYKFYGDAAKISKSGGGIGANYSFLRGKDSVVASTGGVASGPLSFMEVQDVSTDVIKQGGRRRGANMGILDCDHPDVMEFIGYKDTPGKLENFNLSVRVTDEFMEFATEDVETPDDTRAPFAKKLFKELVKRAWSSAEPGILFGDRIEKDNPTPHLGPLIATNPCGEQPLLPYENCCLGSINLGNMINYNELTTEYGSKQIACIDYSHLKQTVHTATLFLNRILDKSILPIPECQEAMEKTRKIGLGSMGLHSMLIQLGIPYDSDEGRTVAKEIDEFITEEAHKASEVLGETEGLYSGWVEGCPKRRNACLRTQAPTGTLSMLANTSSGIEPYYSPITYKTVLDGTTFTMPCKELLDMARELQIVEEGEEWVSS